MDKENWGSFKCFNQLREGKNEFSQVPSFDHCARLIAGIVVNSWVGEGAEFPVNTPMRLDDFYSNL